MSKLRGTVRNGVIVLDPPVELPEGTLVIIEIPAREWLDRFAGIWKDDPGIEAWLQEREEERRAWDEAHP
jgi:hypothetical protein